MGPEQPAVDKLLAVEVLVPYVKAAEDLNLRLVATASARIRSLGTPLDAPRASSAAELDFRRADCAFRSIQATRTDQTSRRGESS